MSSSRPKERELDYLLARGRLSGAEKERVLAAVLDRTEAEPVPKLMAAVIGVGRFVHPWRWALATATVLLLAAPSVWLLRQGAVEDALRVKGTSAAGPVLEAGCTGGCRLGSVLLFRVQGAEHRTFLAAFAVGPSGEKVWYFPAEGGEMPEVAAKAAPQVLPRGARLGPEHVAGTYALHLLLLPERLGRDELLRLLDAGASGVVPRVVPLVVAP